MNEHEWLTSTDPAAMLRLFAPRLIQAESVGSHEVPATFAISDRKLRLFCCACALASSARIAGTAYEQMLADGQAPSGNFEFGDDPKRLAEIWCDHDGLEALMLSHHRPSRHPTKAARADLLRHVVGNPFRRPTVCGKPHDHPPDQCWDCRIIIDAHGWLVGGLAEKVYDGDQSAAGPLHDALIDAGAPNELVWHFADAVPCRRCGGNGWYEDVAGEDLDGRGGRAVNVRCEHDDSLVPMVQEHNDGGVSYWFNLLEPNTRHLTPERAQPRHPKGCWALDLLLGKE